MFNQVPSFEGERESVDRDAMVELFKKRVFERLTSETGAIVQVLRQDTNTALADLMRDHAGQGRGILVEDMEDFLRASVFNPDYTLVESLEIATEGDREIVDEETYEDLRNLTMVPELVKEEIAWQLQDSAV